MKFLLTTSQIVTVGSANKVEEEAQFGKVLVMRDDKILATFTREGLLVWWSESVTDVTVEAT